MVRDPQGGVLDRPGAVPEAPDSRSSKIAMAVQEKCSAVLAPPLGVRAERPARTGPLDPSLSSRSKAFVRKLVRREAKNFYYGFLLLPPRKRRAVYALYAFCRLLDDAVDASASAALDEPALRRRFEALIEGPQGLSGPDRLAAAALLEARAVFPVKRQQLLWIIDGVLMDCRLSRYETFEQLRRYLFGVASAVGLACMEIFGYRDRTARRYAVYLGYAMQLTNIVRDVREDFLRGRIYLPQEDLRRFSVSEEELRRTRVSEPLRRLLAFEAARAAEYFRKARGLWRLVARDAAACPYTLAAIYESLLKSMARAGFEVLAERHSLPLWRKLQIALGAALRFHR